MPATGAANPTRQVGRGSRYEGTLTKYVPRVRQRQVSGTGGYPRSFNHWVMVSPTWESMSSCTMS
jgi:hypothetical protein